MSKEKVAIWDENHLLANFAPTSVTLHRNRGAHQNYPNDVFATSEHLYQMCKFPVSERDIRDSIKDAASPSEAKAITRANKDKIREDWDASFKYKVMRGIIRLKVAQNDHVKDELLSTDRKIIFEDADQYASSNPTTEQIEEMRRWGIYKGEGENWIGKILMDLRKELLQEIR